MNTSHTPPKTTMTDFNRYLFEQFFVSISVNINVLTALLLCEQIAYGRMTLNALCFFLKWIMLIFILSSKEALVQTALM